MEGFNQPARQFVSIEDGSIRVEKEYLIQHGYISPAMPVVLVNYGGIMAGANDALAASAITNGDDADGRCKAFTSAAGGAQTAGIDGGVGALYNMTRPQWNPFVAVRFKLSQIVTQRFWLGLFSVSPVTSDVPVSCVGIRASTVAANTNFVAYSSDAAVNNIQAFPTAVPQDVLVHTAFITFKNNGLGCTIQLDNQKVDFTTRLPAVATPLALSIVVEEAAAFAKVIRVYRGYVAHDERVINVL